MTAPTLIDRLSALSGDMRFALADFIKTQLVEPNRAKDLSLAQELAQLMIALGESTADARVQALGTMAYADTVRLTGDYATTWQMLDEAGQLFQNANDAVGWARTRIGRVGISADMNRVAEAMADAERAVAIFQDHHQPDFTFRLLVNMGVVYTQLGGVQRGIEQLQKALTIAQSMPSEPPDLAMVYGNLGFAYFSLKDLVQARHYFEKAVSIFERQDKPAYMAQIRYNIATIDNLEGKYRQALRMFRTTLSSLSPNLTNMARRDIVDCYIALGRYQSAVTLGQEVIAAFDPDQQALQLATMLMVLGTAEANVGQLSHAKLHFDQAEARFTELQALPLLNLVRLRQGQLAFAQKQFHLALTIAQDVHRHFVQQQQKLETISALLLAGQAHLALGDVHQAQTTSMTVTQLLDTENLPLLVYENTLLLGQIAEHTQNMEEALNYYTQANRLLEETTNGLTIALRPYFMENRQMAVHALIRLRLNQGDTLGAFMTLERLKAQAVFNALASSDDIRITPRPIDTVLLSRLNQLRAEHRWLTRRLYANPTETDDLHKQAVRLTPPEAKAQLRAIERELLGLTEQLDLQNDPKVAHTVPDLLAIQATLQPDDLLIAYYLVDKQAVVFTIDAEQLDVTPLDLTPDTLQALLETVMLGVEEALEVGGNHPLIGVFTEQIQDPLRTLYDALLRPIRPRLEHAKRVIIVPFANLHYLPFHLLFDGTVYLSQTHEVVISPVASLLTRPNPVRQGMRILGYVEDYAPLQTDREVQQIQAIFPTQEVYLAENATQQALQQAPRQILHIACHGEHRLDTPELSALHLADGNLYADDLFQHDMSYELVVLSACETGIAKPTGGDELIGLSRGFLYAGAGALLNSLWRVPDDVTIDLMTRFYHALNQHVSKATALRHAQLHCLQDPQTAHPAFWGAFQLVGNPNPLN